jgi:hypothetical protein
MSFQRDHEPESPARLNRVLAQARRTEARRRKELSSQEVLTTSRLELGLIGPRVLSQYLGKTFTQEQ